MASVSDEIVGYFHRHLVLIFFSFRKGEDVQNTIVTSFVLSVGDQWFLITAGHCLKEIDEITRVHGYEMTHCSLIDTLGQGAEHAHPIPFVYEKAKPACLSDKFDFDYGMIEISSYYKQLLEINNIQPLNEEVWKKQPKKVDFYALLGMPSELVKVNLDSIDLSPTIFTIEQLPKKPDGFPETEIALFYGRIALRENIKSIKGTSGGPIFAFHKNEKGEMRYWLIALQSRWLPMSHCIAACPTALLGDFLEYALGHDNIK